jgi:hypothetical protein
MLSCKVDEACGDCSVFREMANGVQRATHGKQLQMPLPQEH